MSGSNRKFGRHSKRSPAAARYKGGNVLQRNKRINEEKAMACVLADAKKKMKVPRGTARRLRRSGRARAAA